MKFILIPFVFGGVIFAMVLFSFSTNNILTKIIVRLVSKDAKVIGSGVQGALVRIKNLETGEILARGKQEGGTGVTEWIRVSLGKGENPAMGHQNLPSFRLKFL